MIDQYNVQNYFSWLRIQSTQLKKVIGILNWEFQLQIFEVTKPIIFICYWNSVVNYTSNSG